MGLVDFGASTSWLLHRTSTFLSINKESDHEYKRTCRYGRKGIAVKRSNLIKLGVVGLALTVTPIIGAGAAFADYAPQPGDIVGVGGDTPQYAIDFALNGDTNGDSGYDGVATVNRVISFYATPDANGRSAYTNSASTGTASVGLNPTDVLRAGTFPVQRVSSSGAAVAALLVDPNENINFVTSASEPTAAQQTAAQTAGPGHTSWGYLHVVQIATDTVKIAVNSTTNAPSGLSPAELLSIYTGAITQWNHLPGNSGGSADTIIPEIPPTTSSVYKTFVADLKTANGGTAPTLSASVKTVEQNDPTTITTASTPADALVPFTNGRYNLYNSGYFHNPATAYPGGSVLTPGITLLTGTPGDGGAVYSSPITDYVIFRQSDLTTAGAIQPGSSLNWIQYLFSKTSGQTWVPFFDQAAGQALLNASGVTASYADLGDVSSG
jgi:ABC-type phosphate transport system substrate-binding protein